MAKQCHRQKSAPTADDMWMFFPVHTGTLKYGDTITTEGNCFKEITMTLTKVTDAQAKLVIKGTKREDLTCADSFVFGNSEIIHLEPLALRGNLELELNLPGKDAQINMEKDGFETFLLCEAF